jgi:uncharacterized protein with HEPN domain
MPRDARKYLFDIGQASKLISQFVAGKTLDDYLKSALLQSGVERQFEIIGSPLGRAFCELGALPYLMCEP